MTRKRAVQIDEHGDVVVAALGRRLVETAQGVADIVNSDQGAQFTAKDWISALEDRCPSFLSHPGQRSG